MLHIKNGVLHLLQGIRPGWDILTKADKILQIGPQLPTPAEALVLDASGLDVFPGLVLPLCSVGAVGFADDFAFWDKDETSDPLTPHMDIRHAFDLRELKLQRMTSIGVTSYGLSPGLRNLLSGQMAFIHSDGPRTADVFLAEKIALKGNFTKRVKETYGQRTAPQSRMAMYQMLDEAFRAAAEYMQKENADYNAKHQAVVRALRREIPFVVNAYSQNEIENMLELGQKYNLRLVICGGFAAHHCAKTLIEQDIPLVLGDGILFTASQEYGTDYQALVEFYRQGLRLSIGASADEGYPVAYEAVMWTAALLRAAGASADEVMEMMTIQPARALGMEHLVGSLEPGKQADIIICQGNPAQRYDNMVRHTVVAGHHVYKREETSC